MAEIQERFKQDPMLALPLQFALMNSSAKKMVREERKNMRKEKYSAFELVKSWEDGSGYVFLRQGGTGVFVFDKFDNESVYAFKWAVDYAAENGIRNFILDISCNGGGNSSVVNYMMAIMTNSKYHSNVQTLRCLNTLTGNINATRYDIDLNLDNIYDDKDKDVAYDLNFGVLTSSFSFSCGNLLPIMAKDEGIAILGETSGGGSCILGISSLPEALIFTMSGYMKFVSKDNNDADLGAAVDYDLTKKITDADGAESIDYSGLYDIGNLGALLDEFYSSGEEPSQEPSEEPSKEPSEKPSEEPSQQPSEGPSQETSQTVPSPGKEPATGDTGVPFMIVLLMTFAAGTIFAVMRKKNSADK